MEVNASALKALLDWSIETAERAPIDEQVRVYSILAELLPTPDIRDTARQLAENLSRAASLRRAISKPEPGGDGE